MAQETWQGTWGHDWRVGESELAGNKRILWIHSWAAAGWYADVGVILPSHHGLIYIHIHYVLAVIGRLTMGEGLKELNPNRSRTNLAPPPLPLYLSVEAPESLVLNMTFDAYILWILWRCSGSVFLYTNSLVKTTFGSGKNSC